jgi:hypothetical protein
LNQKKHHHFVAETYLGGFCNREKKVCVYLKDKPAKPWWAAPNSVGYEKYYYSQPRPDGGQDNNRLEDFFSTIETHWPFLIEKIERHEPLGADLTKLFAFALMQRVRVPTARDAAEKILAESVRMTGRHLNDLGELPPPPPGLSFEYLEQHTVIAIDPHKSIHAMADFAKGVAKIIGAVGFEILDNQSGEGFITNDNPIIYFDPTVSLGELQPYNISRKRMEIEFMFPLTSKFMLWGHSILKGLNRQPPYRILTDEQFVHRANTLVARFGYRMIFSNEDRHQALVVKYAQRSPVISVMHLKTATGRGIFARHIFGKRESKEKWKRNQNAD